MYIGVLAGCRQTVRIDYLIHAGVVFYRCVCDSGRTRAIERGSGLESCLCRLHDCCLRLCNPVLSEVTFKIYL